MKFKIKNVRNILIASLVISIVCFFITLLISKKFNSNFGNVLFYVSISVILIGVLSMLKGNPSGVYLGDYNTNQTLEAVKKQQGSTEYYKNFKKRSIVELNLKGLALILGGIFLIIGSLLFF